MTTVASGHVSTGLTLDNGDNLFVFGSAASVAEARLDVSAFRLARLGFAG
jgi:hypothetical protein